MTELSLRRHTGIFGLVGTLISLTDSSTLFHVHRCPSAVGHPHARSGGYREQHDSHCFSSRISAGSLPGKATTGVGCDPRARLRPNVADIQLGGAIHGSWNCHCIYDSNRPNCEWRPRPRSIPPAGIHWSAHDDPLPLGLRVRNLTRTPPASLACLVGLPHRFDQPRICSGHVLRSRRGSVLQRRRVGHDGNGSRPRRLLDPHSQRRHGQNSRQV